MKKPSNYIIKIIEEDPERFLSHAGPEGWWAWAIPACNMAYAKHGIRWDKLSNADKWAFAKDVGKGLSDIHLAALRVAKDSAVAVAREYAFAEGRDGTIESKIEALAARVEALARDVGRQRCGDLPGRSRSPWYTWTRCPSRLCSSSGAQCSPTPPPRSPGSPRWTSSPSRATAAPTSATWRSSTGARTAASSAIWWRPTARTWTTTARWPWPGSPPSTASPTWCSTPTVTWSTPWCPWTRASAPSTTRPSAATRSSPRRRRVGWRCSCSRSGLEGGPGQAPRLDQGASTSAAPSTASWPAPRAPGCGPSHHRTSASSHGRRTGRAS